ncbi:hypothetical protein XFF6166_210020 [Xanthomonas citri pv. fuscans]|nr:hypothetical protein XFF6166_210020 [Xanthomonas citri pv. fuscans]SOO06314.1 hypothetical protein XFF7767_70046 [Xanthomonas citri pv. fuscans]SOO10340.1 hypothetical protein XFF6970_540020 [Xanthomonas citri pv. fuscans]SOO15004.1 hypothetical protein XFF7766_460057 [Xanthomonas citri pv. fuscans]SOO45159.1 hypothetical protein XFF1815_70057 [Xanthomonas citri pv. fuscans]
MHFSMLPGRWTSWNGATSSIRNHASATKVSLGCRLPSIACNAAETAVEPGTPSRRNCMACMQRAPLTDQDSAALPHVAGLQHNTSKPTPAAGCRSGKQVAQTIVGNGQARIFHAEPVHAASASQATAQRRCRLNRRYGPYRSSRSGTAPARCA